MFYQKAIYNLDCLLVVCCYPSSLKAICSLVFCKAVYGNAYFPSLLYIYLDVIIYMKYCKNVFVFFQILFSTGAFLDMFWLMCVARFIFG